MNPIEYTAAVLKSFDIEPKPFDRLLDAYFHHHRGLGSRERRLIADCAFGVMRWRRRLDGWLKLFGHNRPDNRLRVLCYIAWKMPGTFESEIRGPFENEMPQNFPGGAAAYYSFPDFLFKKFLDAYGESDTRALCERLNEPARPVVRVNALRVTREDLKQELSELGIVSEPTKLSPFGLILKDRVNLESLKSYKSGHIEIQDEASQLTSLVADTKPGDEVLDVCAGAGGKSLMMAMLMKNKGRIVASDIARAKLNELKKRAMRAGATNIEAVLAGDLKKIRLPKKGFDLVFIDAPCSGTGTLRRSPDLKWRLTVEIIGERVNLQHRLVQEYAALVRPGGRLVYCTCSLLPEENEAIVDELARRKGCKVIHAREILRKYGVDEEGIFTKEGFLKTDPLKYEWDSFFCACIQFSV